MLRCAPPLWVGPPLIRINAPVVDAALLAKLDELLGRRGEALGCNVGRNLEHEPPVQGGRRVSFVWLKGTSGGETDALFVATVATSETLHRVETGQSQNTRTPQLKHHSHDRDEVPMP